ncbi:MAG TPA: glycosyltransferase family 4 protein [Geminicoccaceae bacterium]|nr:glycosyltransferase family 4 protein [Geminicoccaceae bacterium]
MSGRPVAFYAPLKPPDHPVPSGDRRVARALMAALERAGERVEPASRLRSYDRDGDAARQRRIERVGAWAAARLVRRYRARPAAERPRAWLTYHVYHKSPDWIGPAVCRALGLPYLIAEASFAPKRAGGRWAHGHAAAEAAIRSADVALAMTEADAAGLRPLVAPPAELRRLPPFLDAAPYAAARAEREAHRAALAARLGLDPGVPWLLTVAMMRDDAKRESYALLAAALAGLAARDWRLVVVGDGPARAPVEAGFDPGRTAFLGALPGEELPAVYAACDLYAWPALREAYGMAHVEAQAAGLPVVAGREGGVPEVVRDGITGVLAPPRDPAAFARALAGLLGDAGRRRAMGERAARFVAQELSPEDAARRLADALAAAERVHAARARARALAS